MNRLALAIGALAVLAVTWWAFQPIDSGANPPSAGPVSPADVYNPVTAGEPLPQGFRQLLPRDAIAPVYDPVFTTVEDVDWPDEAQVIGVAGGGEAKAYPVSFLNRREMVVDEIGGDPILVTW